MVFPWNYFTYKLKQQQHSVTEGLYFSPFKSCQPPGTALVLLPFWPGNEMLLRYHQHIDDTGPYDTGLSPPAVSYRYWKEEAALKQSQPL